MQSPFFGGRRRTRRRGGFGMFGPFPYYSGQTRRGTRVSFGGCCLPLALALVALPLAAVLLGVFSLG